jgi:rhodanese-related sulfurtransferase
MIFISAFQARACDLCIMRSILILLVLAAITTTTACDDTGQRSSNEAPSAQLAKTTLDAHAFRAAIEMGAILVDVRMPGEFASGHIPGSINLDWTARNHEALFAQLDRARSVLLYCASGGRSDQARDYLVARGYKVQHLDEGIAAWKEAGYPIER